MTWATWAEEVSKVITEIGHKLTNFVAFGNKKTQMIFITIRDGHVRKEGIEKMAKDFQSIMSTGGVQVGIVGVDKN